MLAFAAGAALAAPAKLRTAEEVLRQIDRPAGNASQPTAAESDGAKLLSDIQRYRDESAAMAPADAATRWFALYDRAAKAAPAEQQMDFAAYDLATLQAVGVQSMLASFPPPGAWKAFRQEATQRAARAPSDREALGLRFLAELFDGDHAAANASLDAFERIFAELPAGERERARMQLALARAGITKAYGSAADIAAGFELQLRAGSQTYGYLEVPDLVGLVGEQRAATLLTQAIAGESILQIRNGDATRKLARRIALENIRLMREPQWQLADSVDSAALYEAIEKRFDPASANAEPRADEPTPQAQRDYQSSEATAWYFLASVVAGKQADAERALVKLSRGS
jgi:hypothetical protein